MGHWDHKNICLKIMSKTNLSDSRYEDFQKSWDFTYQQLLEFVEKNGIIHNDNSERIIQFFLTYKNGLLLPDKYNTAEPINKQFDKENISHPIECLSCPGGGLFLKKKNKFNVFVRNRGYSFIFDHIGKKIVATPPKRKPFIYLSSATFWFSKQRKIDMAFLEELLRDLSECMEAEIAVIYDQEDYKILFDLFHPENVGTVFEIDPWI